MFFNKCPYFQQIIYESFRYLDTLLDGKRAARWEGTEKGCFSVEGSKKRKDCNGKTLQSFFVVYIAEEGV